MPDDPHMQLSELGPCQILSRIGEGGMGVVYKGHHRDLDLSVAVKILHPHLVKNSDAAGRFLREARLAVRLYQPAIVRVFDCGEIDGFYFIVMELVEGLSLRQYIEKHTALSVRQSLEIADVVARALGEALQDVGVIHRDIKPDNIMITSGGQVKLADLGLAKVVGQQSTLALTGKTAPGIMLGTPRYMSPEQFIDASNVDHRADIFSLGATLYHMLAGKPPFEGDSIFQVQKQIEEVEPQPLPNHVPLRVEELVFKMLAKNVAARFQTYDELVESIQAAREGFAEYDTIDATLDLPVSGSTVRQSLVPSLKSSGRMLRPASPTEDRALLVVDLQNDFFPDGPLSVPEGDQVVPLVNDLASRFSHLIFTQDWHRPDHLSFASSHPGMKVLDRIELSYGSQILWPDHCVQGTKGAEFHPDLQVSHCELIIRKGYNREIDSYSSFFENDRKTPTGLAGYLRERGLARLFIVGLATDFCVAYTALDGCKLGFQVTVIERACRGINVNGSLKAAWKEMNAAGVIRA